MERVRGRFVVLAVTGSIAVYKMIELARRLTQAGATVQVVMTRSATEFVTPLTFQAITYRPVEVEMFAMQDERAAGHVAMGREADVVVVAPATAHVLARLAHGFSDDLIATTVLATDAPVIVAPAMETHMWQNPATQANVSALRARGVRVVEPESGPLASGEAGPGRLAALERIASAIDDALATSGALAGRHVVVTAGPTVEAIDPVRFVSNRSSGKMGYAIAAAARERSRSSPAPRRSRRPPGCARSASRAPRSCGTPCLPRSRAPTRSSWPLRSRTIDRSSAWIAS